MHCKPLQKAPANGMHRLLPSLHMYSNVLSSKPCLEQTCSRPRLSAAWQLNMNTLVKTTACNCCTVSFYGFGVKVAADPAEVVAAVALELCCCCMSLCLPARQGQGENGCYALTQVLQVTYTCCIGTERPCDCAVRQELCDVFASEAHLVFDRERKRAQQVSPDAQEVRDYSCLPVKSRGCRDVAAMVERCSVNSEQNTQIRRCAARNHVQL